jgi:hypothetical protein
MSDKNAARMFLGAVAEHHLKMAKIHADAAERDGNDCEFHKACMDEHANHAEKCIGMGKAMDTSGIAKRDEGMTVQPSPVSAINPNPSKVFSVPRAGQRPLPIATDENAIDEQFRKIVSLD